MYRLPWCYLPLVIAFISPPFCLADDQKPVAASTPSVTQTNTTAPLQKRLDVLEELLFSEQYGQDANDKRLLRLEKFVFGLTWPGAEEERVSRLEESLEEKDPLPDRKPFAARAAKIASDAAAAQAKAASPTTGVQGGSPSNAKTPIAILHVSQTRFKVDNEPEQMVHELSDAMRNNPQVADYCFQRAKAFIQLGKYDRALSDLSDAIQMVPNNSEYFLARAFVYTKLGNRITARENLQKAQFYNVFLPKQIDFEEPSLADKEVH